MTTTVTATTTATATTPPMIAATFDAGTAVVAHVWACKLSLKKNVVVHLCIQVCVCVCVL